jgi:hypothetical protein
MEKAKRARTAETPKQPSLCLRLRAPYFYPDRAYSAITSLCGATKCPTQIGQTGHSGQTHLCPQGRDWQPALRVIIDGFTGGVCQSVPR